MSQRHFARVSVAITVISMVLAVSLAAPKSDAAFPGYPGQIAFVRRQDGTMDIHVMNGDGSEQTNLTETPDVWETMPSWSPDGKKIAFLRQIDGNAEIFVMNDDGSGQTRLTTNADYDESPVWSPDGQEIAFSGSRGGQFDIFVMNADGTNLHQVTNDATSDRAPDWSPDGSAIAFERGPGEGSEIFTISPDGSGMTQVTQNAKQDEDPSWSPDGSRIAYHSFDSDSNNFDIFVVNADGSGETRLTSDPAEDSGQAWSPDGARMAFNTKRTGNFEIFTMKADGTGVTQLTNTPEDELGPDWQPLPPKQGDANCSGLVDAVDALMDLRGVAGLSSNGCVPLAGNVKCDDGLTAVDSLFILRYVAQLPVTLPPGCPEIGTIRVSFGTGTLVGTWSFDFDAGVQVLTGDVRWDQRSQINRAIKAGDGALIVNVGIVDFAGLTLDGLKALTYGTDPINGSDDATNLLVPGDVFAVLTSEGNYAKVLVVEYGYVLTLQWVTYQP